MPVMTVFVCPAPNSMTQMTARARGYGEVCVWRSRDSRDMRVTPPVTAKSLMPKRKQLCVTL